MAFPAKSFIVLTVNVNVFVLNSFAKFKITFAPLTKTFIG